MDLRPARLLSGDIMDIIGVLYDIGSLVAIYATCFAIAALAASLIGDDL